MKAKQKQNTEKRKQNAATVAMLLVGVLVGAACGIFIARHMDIAGESGSIGDQSAGIDAGILQGAPEETAEGIIADLCDESTRAAVCAERREEVSRSAARHCREGRVTFSIGGFAGEVYEQLAQCDNIVHCISSKRIR